MYSNPSNSDWSILLMTSLRRVTRGEELEVLFSHKHSKPGSTSEWGSFFFFCYVLQLMQHNWFWWTNPTFSDAFHCPMKYCDSNREFEKEEPLTMKWTVETRQEVIGASPQWNQTFKFCSLTHQLFSSRPIHVQSCGITFAGNWCNRNKNWLNLQQTDI